MANAKSYLCKIFWFVLTLFSIAITGVCVFNATADFFSESTDISLVHKKSDEMLYPPLLVCMHHWMAWVNWTAAQKMNFTKHEVLFAMSYLTEIYSSETFNVDEVEKSFYLKLLANNISSVEQFYKSVAYHKCNIIKTPKNKYVPLYDIVLKDFWGFEHIGIPTHQLCYQFSSEEMKKFLAAQVSNDPNELPSNGLILQLKLSDITATKTDMLTWLAEIEYAAQIEGDTWFYDTRLSLDKLFPVGVYPDGFTSSIVLSIQDGKSKVGVMNVEVVKKISSASIPCQKGNRWIASDSLCREKCGMQRKINVSRRRAIYVASNMMKKIPYYRLQTFPELLAAKYEGREIQPKCNRTIIKNDKFEEFFLEAWNRSREYNHDYEQCINNCKREVGCESWTYTYHKAQVQMKSTANLILIYPAMVTATEEVFVQTWENFTSSIGGLLGMFLGASIVTIF